MAGNPSGFMVDRMNAGVSASQALRDWRSPEIGGTFTTAAWHKTWNEVQAGQANLTEISHLPSGAPIDLALHKPWGVENPNGFAYQGRVLLQRSYTLENGQRLTVIESEHATVISEGILTPDEAMAQMMDDAQSGFDAGQYEVRVVGAELHNAYEQVPR